MINKTSFLRAKLQFMAKEEMLDMVSASRYALIKNSDPDPQFRVYVVGHEGEAQGRAVGLGIIKTTWFRDAIRKLGEKLQTGIFAFFGHGSDNGHSGRDHIGEIVGSKVKEINGILTNLIATYIYPEYKDMKLDVASIETNMVYDPDSKAVIDIDDVTGVALGNSDTETPAFPGATLQAVYQMFVDGDGRTKGGQSEMTLKELIAEISSGGFVPSQLFDKDALIRDSVVIEIANNKQKVEYEHRVRTDKKFDEEKAKWETEKAEYETKLKDSALITIKTKTGEVAKTLSEKRKLDEKQVKFLDANLKKFEPKETETRKFEEEVDKFIDGVLDEYESVTKLFGIETKENKENKEKEKPGTPASNKENKDADDMTDPENNDLIPVTKDGK